jgi:outer membrane protein TolC
MLCLPLLGHTETTSWGAWLASQIQQHPDVAAARKQLVSSNANAEAAEQPLYNPELSTDLERNGEENNYQVGVQQTIDWWGRRGVRQQQADYLRSAAEARHQLYVLDKTAEALAAMVEWSAAKRASTIAQVQEQQLNTLLELVEKRQQAGDLGGIDAELTFLSLSKLLAQVAEAESAWQKAEAEVQELLAEWSPEKGGVPDNFWPSEVSVTPDKTFLKHPSVASAHGRWQSLKKEAEMVSRAARAEPTVGINAGRDGEENVVALSFSIPLNVRNNFSAATRAAEETALEAEAHYQAIYRKQRFHWRAEHAAWQRYERQFRRWQMLVKGRVENSAELLQRQWHTGDLSTTDYLLALNQRAESLLAGIELEKQTRLSLTEVLRHSGSLLSITRPDTMPNTKPLSRSTNNIR